MRNHRIYIPALTFDQLDTFQLNGKAEIGELVAAPSSPHKLHHIGCIDCFA